MWNYHRGKGRNDIDSEEGLYQIHRERKTLDNIRKIVTDSDTEKWKGISILRIGGKGNGRI